MITPEQIISAVNDYYQVELMDLQYAIRSRHNVEARQMGMTLLWELTDLKHGEIAEIYNKDRCTVIHAIKTIHNLLKVDRNIRKKMADIKTRIKQKLPVQYFLMTLNN